MLGKQFCRTKGTLKEQCREILFNFFSNFNYFLLSHLGKVYTGELGTCKNCAYTGKAQIGGDTQLPS